MTWIAPVLLYDGDALSIAQLNNMVSENLNACGPGVATIKGRLVVATGKNQVGEAQWARAYDATPITTSGEWPSDPEEDGDPGPTVTFSHHGSFLLLYDVMLRKTSGTGHINYAPEITSGPGVLPDVYNMAVRRQQTGQYIRTGAHVFVTGVEAGTTVVTMKYGNTPGSGAAAVGEYLRRRLTAVPL